MKTLLKKIWMPCLAALLAGSIAALAANTTFFTNIGDLVFPFAPPTNSGATPGTIDNMTLGATTPAAVNGTTGNFTGNLTAPQVNAALGAYAKNPASVASYASYQFANAQTQMLFKPNGTVTYAYVTLAAAPIDGQEACIFTTQTITSLFLNASGSQTLNSAVTTLSANSKVCYKYSLANTTWDRSQ